MKAFSRRNGKMKNKKAIFLSVLLVVVIGLLGACGSGSSDSATQQQETEGDSNDSNDAATFDEVTIKVANFFADDHPQNVSLREVFKPIVEEKTGGAVKVEIYPNSQIGNEEAFTEGVRNGTIEMALFGTILSSSAPKIGVLDLPFLFRDYDHAKAVLDSEIGDEIGEEFRNLGIEPLVFSANGFRVVSSSKPIYSLEDFKGLRLRMPNAPVYIETGKALGASVHPLSMSEVFTALESGVVDAQENPYSTLKASGWYEVQDYVLESRHLFSTILMGVNQNFWNSLSKETQDVIMEAARETAEYEWKLLQEDEEEVKQFLTEQGLEITIPDEEFKKDMAEAVKPVHQQYYDQYDWAEELIEKIQTFE